MNNIKRRLNNLAVGLLPLLLFMFLNNYYSYLLTFGISVACFIVCIVLYRVFSKKEKTPHYMLLPVAVTFLLYSIFLFFRADVVLEKYSSVIIEVLLVVVLAFVGFFRRITIRKVRDSNNPPYRRAMLRTTLNEFYFLVQLVQNLYTFHLFAILIYTTLPDAAKSDTATHLLYHELGLLIGILVIIYEQVRLMMMKGRLKKEKWLPVLSEKGKVIGCIARSVSRAAHRKYFHPVVRIAVIYNGMLYLTKRSHTDYEDPDTLDYPYQSEVLFRHTIEGAVKTALGKDADNKQLSPRFTIRYTFENEKVKQLVSLFVICVRNEKAMERIKTLGGKLWTERQIEDNLGKGVFSGYFEEEFPYIQKTILYAENFCKCNNNIENKGEEQKPAV